MRGVALIIGLCALVSSALAEPPLLRAHAHNDYEHEHPLVDALSHGFWSVEADVWLRGGELVVSHDAPILSGVGTLQGLYLDPLRDFVRTNGDAFKTHGPLTLLVDVKSEAKQTYAALDRLLRGYTNILTRFEGGRIHTNALLVIISGSRAVDVVRTQAVRFVAIDGRLPDLETHPPPPAALMPLVSDNWTASFRWRGKGAFEAAEKQKLQVFVKKAHDQGRRVRFWGTPDHAAVWREMFEAGVDLLNTDKLAEMEGFLRVK